jgi:hypothetical protein
MKVCIPFTPMPASENPNINSSSDAKSKDTYYKTIIVSFFSLRKFNPFLNLTLITTEEPPKHFHKQLDYLSVNIQIIPFIHRPPQKFASRFTGCFYLLDALSIEEQDDCLYLDPDVLCLSKIPVIFSPNMSILAYALEISPFKEVSGLKIEDSKNIAFEIFTNNPIKTQSYQFYGGEFYYIPRISRKSLAKNMDLAFLNSVQRFELGSSYFPTEEHLLSAAFINLEVAPANHLISRVWTAPTYRNVTGTEMERNFLHFPAEKEWGFTKTYKKLFKTDNPLLDFTDFEFLAYIERVFQLKRPSLRRISIRMFLRIIELFKS